MRSRTQTKAEQRAAGDRGPGGAKDIPLSNVAPGLQLLSLQCHPATTQPPPSPVPPSPPSNNNLTPKESTRSQSGAHAWT